MRPSFGSANHSRGDSRQLQHGDRFGNKSGAGEVVSEVQLDLAVADQFGSPRSSRAHQSNGSSIDFHAIRRQPLWSRLNFRSTMTFKFRARRLSELNRSERFK